MSRRTKRVVDRRSDETTFTLHGTPLDEIVVPVAYGLFSFLSHANRAWDTLFPEGAPFVLGGCVIMDNSPTHARIRSCPDCRRAFAEWSAEYPDEFSGPRGILRIRGGHLDDPGETDAQEDD